MPAISEWLAEATRQLQAAGITSARLDTELILTHTLRKPRTYLHAHGDELLSSREHEIADARLQLRLDRTPIAYIIGHKEFYGRPFRVTTATLIPRPESEAIISMLADAEPTTQPLLPETRRLVDIGTGSGCLGITAKLEHPELDVTLLDISNHALRVAEQNAAALHADVQCIKSDLLSNYPFIAHYIIANLPYVDRDWERSPETNHEPSLALFADDDGLSLIKKLITQLPNHLTPGGVAFFEADPRQHDTIITFAAQHGLIHDRTEGFIVSLVRRR